MGKRTEWTAEEIAGAFEAAGGNYTEAASILNADRGDKSKVTRQNMQTWVNAAEVDADETPLADMGDNFELARKLRHQMNSNNELRRQLRNLNDAAIAKSDVLTSLAEVVATMDPNPVIMGPSEINPAGRGVTVELLFSDLQVGKLMDGYTTEIAVQRVREWADVATARIVQYQLLGYKVERIVLAVLGDIIESDKKHSNSGRACDIGTADQMKLAIELLFNAVILRLAHFGVPMDVVMVTGNHDHDGHGLNMFKPGREHLSWPLYHAVRMLSEQAGIDATFYIPEGSFFIYDLYGQSILYEHGVGVATSEAAMRKHVSNRIAQQKRYIHLFRMGDKHNVCRFNNDRFVVNGAFFGDSRTGDEYSGIVGYDGYPAQIMFAHVNRTDDFRTSLFDSLAIQLGHIR